MFYTQNRIAKAIVIALANPTFEQKILWDFGGIYFTVNFVFL